MPQCISHLEEVLAGIPLRCGPAEQLGRRECGRNGKGCWATARAHSCLPSSGIHGAESVLSKNWPEKPRATPVRAREPKLEAGVICAQGRSRCSCSLCFHWSGIYSVAFLPRVLLIPKMLTPSPAAHRCPTPVWATVLVVGERGGRDFWQELSRKWKRFSSVILLMLMGVSAP